MKKSDMVKMLVEDILVYHYENAEEQAYDILRVLEKNGMSPPGFLRKTKGESGYGNDRYEEYLEKVEGWEPE